MHPAVCWPSGFCTSDRCRISEVSLFSKSSIQGNQQTKRTKIIRLDDTDTIKIVSNNSQVLIGPRTQANLKILKVGHVRKNLNCFFQSLLLFSLKNTKRGNCKDVSKCNSLQTCSFFIHCIERGTQWHHSTKLGTQNYVRHIGKSPRKVDPNITPQKGTWSGPLCPGKDLRKDPTLKEFACRKQVSSDLWIPKKEHWKKNTEKVSALQKSDLSRAFDFFIWAEVQTLFYSYYPTILNLDHQLAVLL